ncbi:aspartate aminotransferase family protein [Ilumatobacter coccineus]|uniref:Putative beta-transaminase n=1 Tax=Ilumatobacter coccineus (strain NBRC 103263 / KCTC 29153 / YM16-304) TaxID=1313172 RepID=A0A6C7EIW1_ILUCY|nr:aspartate aminotransferase family protein [Ilumatobacter coccineus]BAN04478.1 putative beta-transaminase [Ilumatobacter coccineus YM16-304]
MLTLMDLDAAVTSARASFVAAHPEAATWSDRARRVQPGGNTRSVLHVDPFPIRVDRAEGKHLWDLDGHRYVDLLGNYTAGLLGHSPEPVLAAARAALESGWSLGAVHENEVRLAELIVERFPSLDQVRFTNSGTEANMMALAVATHHTGRRKVVVFRNGYHGGVLTFGAEPSPVTVPHDWVLCDFNDLDSVSAAFAEHGVEIAAVLVEPMQGSGGCIPGTPAFLAGLRSLCDDHGALLVFDEVMTSRFSTGGAQQLLGVQPDMTTLGKYLAGGLTFGAFGGRADVMANFDPAAGGTLAHAGTFNNNVASMAAGVAALTEVLSPELLDEVHARGERLRVRLNEAFAAAGLPMCATGVGSLMNVHGTAGPVGTAADLADQDDRLRELFYFHCLANGYYIARRGLIALSIEITDDDIDQFLDVVGSFGTDD